jgi:fructose-bisphosphate aldolase/2-amino-3,7-dideoxy-D-threo-hept-6-ulosonate synthase
MYGKRLRLERIKNKESENFLFITMDHGITYGVLPGLEDIGRLIRQVEEGGADAVLLHKGNAKNVIYSDHGVLEPFRQGLGLIIHLNGTPSIGSDPYLKVPVCTVAEAVQYGADAVSLHVNIGDVGDEEMLEFLGEVGDECLEWGMPLIAMIYPRGSNFDSEYDPEAISHCVRIGVEFGADIIKTHYTGDVDSFKKICSHTPIPIVVAGGPRQEKLKDFYRMVEEIMNSGARGMAVGRNIFGTTDPMISTRIVSDIVHKRIPVNDLFQKYKLPSIK